MNDKEITNKDKVYRLALEGQKVETAKDTVKAPYRRTHILYEHM